MEKQFEKTVKQAAAFQKMWMDSMTGITQVWTDYSPQEPPPGELKKARQGVLKVVSKAWEEYMRSPEFLEAMRDTMNNSVQWQKWAKENSKKIHQAAGTASKEDMQGVMIAVQHVERRVLDCLDDMQSKVANMQSEIDSIQEQGTMSMELYQQEVMERLAKIEKAMMNGAKAASEKPEAPKPKATVTKTKAPAKKTAAKKPVAKKVTKKAAKKTAKKVAQSKTPKVGGS